MRTETNLKLNIWRLQSEKRYVKINGKGQSITVLALRNQHGILKGVTKDPSEQSELRKWYRKYNRTIKTEDLPTSKKLRKKLTLIIGDLRERGFIHREICFGTARNRKTGKHQYKRMEVLKATPWTRRERHRIWNFFKIHVPKSNLGIYVLHQNKLYMYPITATA